MKHPALVKHAVLSGKGLEIAPYFKPALAKSDGYDVMSLDVFDTETLIAKAEADPTITPQQAKNIEPVDFVADACELGSVVDRAGLAGQFDYIISSHNFEHLANPVKFLQGAAHALREGGTLSMAIPDYRCCFDQFRIPTRLVDWLDAFHIGVRQPTPATIFDYNVHALGTGSSDHLAYKARLDDLAPPKGFMGTRLREKYGQYLEQLSDPGDYVDAHCNVLFPELFELHLRDLRHLGILPFDIIEVTPTRNIEFIAHLRRGTEEQQQVEDAVYARQRQALLEKIASEIGYGGFGRRPKSLKDRCLRRMRWLALNALGTERVLAIRAWNQSRRTARRNSKNS